LVADGAYVFITGRRQSELDAAVKQIGTNVTGIQETSQSSLIWIAYRKRTDRGGRRARAVAHERSRSRPR